MTAEPFFVEYPDASILEFRGATRWLSNFHEARTSYERIVYPTSEHAFVAAKTLDLALREQIRKCPTAAAAKRMGRVLALRPGWDGMSERVMREVVYDKFKRAPELGQRLVATSPKRLAEGNDWHDTKWGACTGSPKCECAKVRTGYFAPGGPALTTATSQRAGWAPDPNASGGVMGIGSNLLGQIVMDCRTMLINSARR